MLVVDERQSSRLLLVKLLEPLGVDVHEAANGQEAIEVWERRAPHLIWMDMRMPVMDGYEATRRIKARPGGQSTVIVAATASAFEDDRERILAVGCDDVLRKPLREEEVFSILARHLEMCFAYEEVEPAPPRTAVAHSVLGDADPELVGRLAVLAPEWIARLQEATVLGELASIAEVIDQIGEQDAELGEALAALAHQFEHDRILMLIRRAGGEP
jgi:CheY-like chemotaxis protein